VLRWLALALLLANLAFFSWTQGWLDNVVGVRASGDREPDRLARQVRPEAVLILPPSAAAAAAASAAETGLACLEAGPFSGLEVAAAEAALAPLLPLGSWLRVTVDKPAVWAVYVGRFASAEAQAKKEVELQRLRVEFETLAPSADLSAELTPGVSLGRFGARDAAEAALARLSQSGVRAARVVELQPPAAAHLLRVAQAEPALAARLTSLKPDLLGKPFMACASAP
jgi:hypothetical protein